MGDRARPTLAAVLLDAEELLSHRGNTWLTPETRADLAAALASMRVDLAAAVWPDDADATHAAAALGISAATLFRLRRAIPRPPTE